LTLFCAVLTTVAFPVSSPIFPNAGSLAANATFAAEQRALFDAGKPSAFSVVRTLGSTFGTFAYKDLVGMSPSVINDAKKRNAASSLLPGEDKTVIAGYKAQREILIKQFENPDIPVVMAAFDTFSSVMLAVLKPFSRGRVTIKSTNPREEPRMDFRTATDPADLPVFVGTLRRLRQIMSAPDMASMGTTEIAPFGAHIQSDAEWTAALRQNLLVSSAHQCCSAPMMPLKLGGVVDAKHNVYGVTGLRVADVSTFPIAVAGGPTANVYGVAEKVCRSSIHDLVKNADHHRLPTS
jgi:choline dehydrogenase-like flavoprotein